MLVLTRKPNQSIFIGDRIKITVVEIKGNQVRLGIEAPSDQKIYREEIYQQIANQNQTAASTTNKDTIDQLATSIEEQTDEKKPSFHGPHGRKKQE